MHSFWLGWEAISDSACTAKPHVQFLSTTKSTIMRFFALAFISELMAGSTSEYLPAIKNGDAPPASSRGT